MAKIIDVNDLWGLASPFIGFSRFLTPRRFRKNERKVATLTDFEDVHRSIVQTLDDYLDRSHSNYVRLRSRWFEDTQRSKSYLLSAANMEARIAFARIALRQLQRNPELFRGPLHFVTISPADYICHRETASRTNLRSLQKLTGQALAGLSFVGAPDFALFKSWGQQGIRELNNHVGPHTHNLVFGETREQIEASLERAGLQDRGWAGNPAYHIKSIKAEKLEGYLLYVLKAPLFEYHAVEGARLYRNWQSKEMEKHGRFPPYPLRTGDQLCMLAVTNTMFLDEMFFGQGLGTAFVRSVREEARAPLRHAQKIARRTGQVDSPTTPEYTSEDRPLLSDCVIHPPSWLRRLQRRARISAAMSRAHQSHPAVEEPSRSGQKYIDELNDYFNKL